MINVSTKRLPYDYLEVRDHCCFWSSSLLHSSHLCLIRKYLHCVYGWSAILASHSRINAAIVRRCGDFVPIGCTMILDNDFQV